MVNVVTKYPYKVNIVHIDETFDVTRQMISLISDRMRKSVEEERLFLDKRIILDQLSDSDIFSDSLYIRVLRDVYLDNVSMDVINENKPYKTILDRFILFFLRNYFTKKEIKEIRKDKDLLNPKTIPTLNKVLFL